MKIVELIDGKYVKTNRHLDEYAMRAWRREAKRIKRRAHIHMPGSGLHPVRSDFVLVFSIEENERETWTPKYETSENGILAHVHDLCMIYDLDYMELMQQAYPDDPPEMLRFSHSWHKMNGRHATAEDIDDVFEDLEQINHHSLAEVLQRAIQTRQGQEE
jgi:hypothetical protein